MAKQITSQDLERFHAAKGVTDISCPRCGYSAWFVHSTDGSVGARLGQIDENGQPSAERIDTIVLICSNCANIWMMAMDPIAEWLEGNPDAKQ